MEQDRGASPPGGGPTEESLQRLSMKGREQLTRDDLPTPALLVDLDLMEANLERMSQFAREASLGLRPHMKTHKCPEIARRQVRAGAAGVCVAHLGEAEAIADAGIPEILITSQLVGPRKVERPASCRVVAYVTDTQGLRARTVA